jgi:hypothetical protein
MTDKGSWGAWQVEPSRFTKSVVDAMRKLSVFPYQFTTPANMFEAADTMAQLPRGACR